MSVTTLDGNALPTDGRRRRLSLPVPPGFDHRSKADCTCSRFAVDGPCPKHDASTYAAFGRRRSDRSAVA